jgi:hypothetical protein
LLNHRYEKCVDTETETVVAIKKWKDNDKDQGPIL